MKQWFELNKIEEITLILKIIFWSKLLSKNLKKIGLKKNKSEMNNTELKLKKAIMRKLIFKYKSDYLNDLIMYEFGVLNILVVFPKLWAQISDLEYVFIPSSNFHCYFMAQYI